MYVKEIWRYPAKSMAGERLAEARMTELGLQGDRHVLAVGRNGRVLTARTHHRLLGLRATIGPDGEVKVNGHPWKSAEVRELVQAATVAGAELTYYAGAERFDILPLLVATDGALEYLGFDSRRFRPNLIIGGVEGLAERDWPGRRLRIGEVVIHMAQLRGRCVMTTYDPDTLEQDLNVLKTVVRQLDGTLGLDSSVEAVGRIREGDPVVLVG